MISTCLSLLVLAVCATFQVSYAGQAHIQHRAHDSVVRRHIEIAANNSTVKRGGGARFSWYDAGLGACGKVNKASDFIVALNVPQWDGGSHCFQTVTIKYGGKSAQAQVVDECEGCPYSGLDFSRALFQHFADPDIDGIVYGEWSFGSGDVEPDKPKTTTKAKPTPTPTPKHSTTTTSTSTTTKSSTTSAASSSSQTSSTTTSSSQTATKTTSATSTPTPSSVDGPQTLNQLNIAFIDLTSCVASIFGKA